MDDCIFCGIVAGRIECSVVYDDERFLAFMDIHPARPGHLLIVPKQHRERVGELPDETAKELWAIGLRVAAAMRASGLPCDDVHFLLNDGRAANQTVPHVHLHIVPRRDGDLWRLAAQLLMRPMVPVLGPASRATLDHHAEMIRKAL